MTLWLWGEQALAVEKLPGEGAGPDVRAHVVHVLGVADPGYAVFVHAHASAFHGTQVRLEEVMKRYEVVASREDWTHKETGSSDPVLF
jgi:hypothetical protein